ncbi:unnamed protein product [Ostreobium quekettii]|uniref:Cullin N-terminal domain-containing protein n=1 Tax=Ostreobium quekettii TaxID=121088 RepID=A0A8S1J915_9CHLO|nr:unnamed protein product [Ostreobium quekettii]
MISCINPFDSSLRWGTSTPGAPALILEDLLAMLHQPAVGYSEELERETWEAVAGGYRAVLAVDRPSEPHPAVLEARRAACALRAAGDPPPGVTRPGAYLQRLGAKLDDLLASHLDDVTGGLGRLRGTSLLEGVAGAWERYRGACVAMQGVLRTLGFSQPPCEREFGLWASRVVDSRLAAALVEAVAESRDGPFEGLALVKSVNGMLRDVGAYHATFEEPALGDARRHFAEVAEKGARSLDLAAYAAAVEGAIDAERRRWAGMGCRQEARPGEGIEALARRQLIDGQRDALLPRLEVALARALDGPGGPAGFPPIYRVFRGAEWARAAMVRAFRAHLKAGIDSIGGAPSADHLRGVWRRYGRTITEQFCENEQLWKILFHEVSASAAGGGAGGRAIKEGEGLVGDMLRTQPYLRDDPWGKGLPDELIRLIAGHTCGQFRPACSPWRPGGLDSRAQRLTARMVNSDWCRAISDAGM